MPAKITHDQFVERVHAHAKFQVVGRYVGMGSYVRVRCASCNTESDKHAGDLSRGIGCQACYTKGRRLTDYQAKLNEVHGGKITFKGEYVNMMTSLIHVCQCGHEWNALPQSLTVYKYGCSQCAYANRSKALRFTDAQYAARVAEVHGAEISYVSGYAGLYRRAVHRCSYGHEWACTPQSTLRGHGCRVCANKKGYSSVAIEWMDYLESELGIKIQHAESACEKYIKFEDGSWALADGYCEELNAVFEFHGSCWHGDPALYGKRSKPHPLKRDLTAHKLLKATLSKEMRILEAGYKLVTIWESDYWKSSWEEVAEMARADLSGHVTKRCPNEWRVYV